MQKIESYKNQCKNQLEDNKRLKDLQKQKEEEAIKKVPKGPDLMG